MVTNPPGASHVAVACGTMRLLFIGVLGVLLDCRHLGAILFDHRVGREKGGGRQGLQNLGNPA